MTLGQSRMTSTPYEHHNSLRVIIVVVVVVVGVVLVVVGGGGGGGGTGGGGGGRRRRRRRKEVGGEEKGEVDEGGRLRRRKRRRSLGLNCILKIRFYMSHFTIYNLTFSEISSVSSLSEWRYVSRIRRRQSYIHMSMAINHKQTNSKVLQHTNTQ